MPNDRPPRAKAEGPIEPSIGLQVTATNGYTVEVIGVQEDRSGLPVSLVALFAKAKGARVEYLVQGVVSEDAISAQIGTLGSVDMHFEPSGAIGTFRQDCSQGSFRGHEGTWRGTVQFTGENGYTSVDATEGSPIWPGSSGTCDSGSSSGGPGAWLSVTGVSGLNFAAAQNKGPGTATQFEASALEQGPGGAIRSEIWTSGPARDFTYDRGLRRAMIRPPAPFTGTAHLYRKPGQGQGSWSGSLRASFPGLPGALRLAGPRLHAALQRGSHEQSH